MSPHVPRPLGRTAEDRLSHDCIRATRCRRPHRHVGRTPRVPTPPFYRSGPGRARPPSISARAPVRKAFHRIFSVLNATTAHRIPAM